MNERPDLRFLMKVYNELAEYAGEGLPGLIKGSDMLTSLSALFITENFTEDTFDKVFAEFVGNIKSAARAAYEGKKVSLQ